MAANLEKLAPITGSAGARTVVYCGQTLGMVRDVRYVNFADMDGV